MTSIDPCSALAIQVHKGMVIVTIDDAATMTFADVASALASRTPPFVVHFFNPFAVDSAEAEVYEDPSSVVSPVQRVRAEELHQRMSLRRQLSTKISPWVIVNGVARWTCPTCTLETAEPGSSCPTCEEPVDPKPDGL